MGMNAYLKVGKYWADNPSNWGGEINAPTLELGYERKNCIKTFLSFSLYNWGYVETAWYTKQGTLTDKLEKEATDDINSPYLEPWGNDKFGEAVAGKARYALFDSNAFGKASLISTFGLSVPIFSLGEFSLRVPLEVAFKEIDSFTNNFRLMPVLRLYLDRGFFFSNTHLALALRRKDLNKGAQNQDQPEIATGYTVMGKQELGFRYASIWETDLLESPEWLALVNKKHKLNPLWAPKDLVNLKQAGVATYRNDICLRAPLIEPLKKLIQEAHKDGIKLWVVSAYRDIGYQQRVWDTNVAQSGLEYTKRYVAVPGSSQHHLGSVVDLNLADEAFDDTQPAIWLSQNAQRFGFSLSYPKGYEKETGYSPESWHYRYFPGKISLFIDQYFNGLQFAFLEFWHKNASTIEEFLNNDCKLEG
ncbi:UNVERIFIED_CONTAM: hypothetical protein PYX00_011214 [Menopon gallinae]|uniref:D-alanyl-D-alanine carboxypeptidase-like core domain-containing protein n=1 Tax=Menopon gallinae TaxID=328185 RepID=A0AAW2H6I6_9NEOP